MQLLLKELLKRFKENKVMDLSAQCAYYFLLSLFPFLIFAITLLGYMPISTGNMLALVEEYIPQGTYSFIENNLTNILENQNPGLLSLGILFTIWTSSHALNAIIGSLNMAYNITEPRPFWKARIVSIGLTLSMIIVILMAFILIVFGQNIGVFVRNLLDLPLGHLYIWEILRFSLGFIILNFAFIIIYKFAPNRKIRIKEVILGSIIATLGWQLTSMGFSFYVNNFTNYSAIHGSLGAVIVLMLWFHLSAMILITGGQINALIYGHVSNNSKS